MNTDSCCCLVTKLCLTLLQPHGLYPARLLCPWDFPGKNIGVGWHFLLQGIFPTQSLNPRLLHWQVDSLPLSIKDPYFVTEFAKGLILKGPNRWSAAANAQWPSWHPQTSVQAWASRLWPQHQEWLLFQKVKKKSKEK